MEDQEKKIEELKEALEGREIADNIEVKMLVYYDYLFNHTNWMWFCLKWLCKT